MDNVRFVYNKDGECIAKLWTFGDNETAGHKRLGTGACCWGSQAENMEQRYINFGYDIRKN